MRYSLLIFGSISAILLLCTPGKYIRKLHFPDFIVNRIFLVILQQGTHIFLIYHICYIWKVEDKEKPFALAVILSPFEHHLGGTFRHASTLEMASLSSRGSLKAAFMIFASQPSNSV